VVAIKLIQIIQQTQSFGSKCKIHPKSPEITLK